LFVAVWPDPAVLEAVAAFERPDLPGGRWTTADQWHVTLRFLGEVAEADLTEVADAVRAAAARHRPVDAVLGPVTGRFKERILHVPVAGLDELAADVIDATATMGDAPPDDRAFQGHLTLARVRPWQARLSSPALPPALVGRPLAGSWTVRELTLVASDRRPGGSAYSVVDRAPLATDAATGDGSRGGPGGGSGPVPDAGSGDGSGAGSA
jgi:2'-5' RNA ligase